MKKLLRDLNYNDEPLIFEGGMYENDGYRLVDDLLAMDINSCAIFAVNDPVAVGAVKRLKELHIDVPQQIGIAGFFEQSDYRNDKSIFDNC